MCILNLIMRLSTRGLNHSCRISAFGQFIPRYENDDSFGFTDSECVHQSHITDSLSGGEPYKGAELFSGGFQV